MSYSSYYSGKNCCVKSKNLCPNTCPTGPTGRIGQVGPIGPTGRTGPTGPIGITGPQGYSTNFDPSGNLDISCNFILDVSGIYFCDGTYIGHGASFDISTNEFLHLKSNKQIVIDPSNVLGVKGTLDMCGNTIVDVSLNLNTNSTNQFLRYNVANRQIWHKSIDYASLSCDVSQNLTSSVTTNLYYNTVDISNNGRIKYDIANPSRITFSQEGIYKIGTSIQFAVTSGGAGNNANVYIWFKNKLDNIENSASLINLVGNNARTFNYVEIIYEVTDITDYIEILSYTIGDHVSAFSIDPSGSQIPGIPSIITTVIQIA